MMISRIHIKKYYFSLLACFLLLVPFGVFAGGPIGASLQTKGNPVDAAAGGTNSAMLSVVVTSSNSRPADSLAANVGDGSAQISLPTGWSLTADFNNPTLALCGFIPTQFTNEGGGIYTIQVEPDGCNWATGEFHYVIELTRNRGNGNGNGGSRRQQILGSILGTVSIP